MSSLYAQGRDGELYLVLDQAIKAIENAGRADEPGAAVVLGFLRNCLAIAQEWAPTRDTPFVSAALGTTKASMTAEEFRAAMKAIDEQPRHHPRCPALEGGNCHCGAR